MSSSVATLESASFGARSPHESPIGRLLLQAKISLRSGDWAHAGQLYLEVIREIPEELEALEGLGLTALQNSRPAEALAWFERAQRAAPDNVRVLSNLGVAQGRNGLLSHAIASYRRALELDPSDARVLVNLARSEREAQRLDEAARMFRRALELSPDAAEIWSMLSNVLREKAELDAAVHAAQTALEKNPWLGDAHLNEGAALHLAGRVGEALISYFAASTIANCRAAALNNLRLAVSGAAPAALAKVPILGLVRQLLKSANDEARFGELARALRAQGRAPAAILCFERALELGHDAEAPRELATLLWEQGHADQATARLALAIERDPEHVASFRLLGDWLAKQDPNRYRGQSWKVALDRCPDDLLALVNIGAAAQRRGYAVEGARLQRRAIQLDPNCLEAHLNLGSALSDQGLAAEATAVYRQALELAPTSWPLYSNRLFTLHLDPTQSRGAIFDEHVDFGRRLSASITAPRASFPHTRQPDRPLRIGYISPDFRNHPVAHFIEPVLREHDPEAVTVFCYSDVEYPDPVTARLSKLVPHFVPVAGMRHAALLDRIQADEIDVLVDLAGHTGRNRLPVFAARPSPVQVSWLGYFDTTGLESIGYRIADAHSVTPADEAFFVEKVVRLPRSANCYLPPPSPEPSHAPCLQNGYVTFGCFNNPMKVGRQVVALFAEVLRRVPNSRLLFKYSAFNDPHRRARYIAWLKEESIGEERIQFEGPSALPQFMAAFEKIDVALDPFPYSGETTALHTLWMGVPLVVLGGPSLVERLASRVLSICNHSEWIAGSSEDYVRIAAELAADMPRLSSLRRELRDELRASPLLDHVGVTRELEAAYRQMWQSWCANAG
jgi:protein O-GlcNAc transferase